MSFYVNLSSDQCDDDSKIGSFNTNLHKNLLLNGNYEVALVELSYPITWQVPLGSISIQYIDTITTIALDTIYDHSNGSQIAAHIRSRLRNGSKYDLNCNYNTYAHELRIKSNKSDIVMTLDEECSKLLDITYPAHSFSDKYIHHVIKLEKIPYLNIFCDIITNQFEGNIKSKLLRKVRVDGVAKDIMHHIYDNPHYCQINKTYISSIEISIRDQYKRIVNFQSGNVYAKLHFRKQE